MAHTQGQWEVLPGKDATGDETLCIRGNGEFIATMDVVSIDGAPYRLPDNGEANARLIAAAPELLEAMESLFEHCEMVHKHWGDGDNTKEANAAIEAGKAAIAKAKGL